MSKSSTAFILEDELDELAYDFRTPGNKKAPHGVIPEPSTEQLDHFTSALRTLNLETQIEAEELKDLTPSEMMARVAALKEGDTEEPISRLVQAVAAVCSGCPSVEDISSLSFRAQRAFFGWITGQLLDPK